MSDWHTQSEETNQLKAEIERLQARAWASQAADALQLSAEENYRLKAEIERLEAENEQLDAALKKAHDEIDRLTGYARDWMPTEGETK